MAVDFNGDRRTDLAVADELSDSVTVLMGDGKRTLGPALSYPLRSDAEQGNNVPLAIAAGNFFGDGIPGLAVFGYDPNSVQMDDPNSVQMVNVTILRGDGRGGFEVSGTVFLDQASFPNSAALTAGDFTGSGYSDLAVVDSGTGEMTVLLNQGNGIACGRDALSSIGLMASPGAVVAGDFDGNGTTTSRW